MDGKPPVARVEPVVDVLHGRRVADPYRWMENPDDPEWAPFMAGQGAHARQALDGLPGRAAMLERVSALSSGQVVAGRVHVAGGLIFYEQRPAGAQSFVLYVAERLDGPAMTLIDPSRLVIDGGHVSIDWWSVSPNGRYVAYGLSIAGSEQSVLHVVHVESRQVLPELIDRTPFARPSWLPDSTGFFYNQLQDVPMTSLASRQNSVCRLHMLGDFPEGDRPMLARGLYPDVTIEPFEIPSIHADPSSPYVVAVLRGGVRHANPLFTARLDDLLSGTPQWRPVATVEDSVTDFAVLSDTLFLLSTRESGNGRVQARSLSSPQKPAVTVAAPQNDLVFESLTASADAIYISAIDAGYGRLLRLTSGKPKAVPLPYEGSLVGVYATTGERAVHVALTGWLQPRSVWAFDPVKLTLADTGFPKRPDIDTWPYVTAFEFAIARDGTRVPLSIISRRNAPRNGKNPVLVNGYGAYQVVIGPSFNARLFAFLERGGVYVTAHVRGGGEYGESWWTAGKGAKKHNSWRDLIDICEHLVAQKWTAPRRLAIWGGSAGGITVGRALTERPDLFGAVVCRVGVLNTLRAEFAPNGPPNVPEYGSIADKAGFEALHAMDALHAVKDGVRYPPVLLTHGLTDPRVEPWHSAKFAARLQAADPAGEILLRVTADAGHGVGSTRTQIDEEQADIYAFVLAHTANSKT